MLGVVASPRRRRDEATPGPETIRFVDAVALVSVISSAAVGLTGAGAAFYAAHRAAKTAREGRGEQRAADGYLKVLSLAEQEAQWNDASIFNLGLDPQELAWGTVEMVDVPAQPAPTDRATAAALIAAFASEPARTSHAAWREASDAVRRKIQWICIGMGQEGDPQATVPAEWMKELVEELQPKERAARQVLAEAVAKELGHR